MTKVTVSASRQYDIIIGEGLLKDAGKYAKNVISGGKALVVTDDIVSGLYGETLCQSLSENGFSVQQYVTQHGEASKSTDNLINLLNFLAENRYTRSDTIFALGGGVVGDLSGFAAAVYLRGINYIGVPTTLLAAVDSSVGGKTAVNLKAGKNLVGAFYQPNLVISDYSTFSTLSNDIFNDGMAEVIKYGMISDNALFQTLKKDVTGDIETVIAACVKIKSDVVNKDERDTGVRRLLNFGHTLGHAVEILSNFEVSHGSAVAIGMAIISRNAAKKGFCSRSVSDCLEDLLNKYSLPTTTDFSTEDIYNAALGDKKRTGDTVTLVLPREIGKCVLKEISVEELYTWI